MKRTREDKFAISPFKTNSIQKTSLGSIVQDTSLSEHEVLFHPRYTKVWVAASDCVRDWAKAVYDLDGTKFVLCPVDRAILLDETDVPQLTACGKKR